MDTQALRARSRLSRPRAISRRRSRSWSRAERRALRTRRCSASPAAARHTPWRASSSACSARRWCWRTTRRWRRSSTASSASSSRTTRWSTSSPTTTTTSPRPTCPPRDTYIEKDASVNEHIEQMRLSATKALLERPDSIIVATVSSIYGLGDPQAYLAMVLHLVRGDRMDQRRAAAAPGRHAVHAQRARPHAGHLPRARRRHRHLPGRVRARGGARGAVRRHDRVDHAVRSADRRDRAQGAALHRLSGHPLRDAARAAGRRGRPDPRGAARSASRSCATAASWSRRSASSSARCSTWR